MVIGEGVQDGRCKQPYVIEDMAHRRCLSRCFGDWAKQESGVDKDQERGGRRNIGNRGNRVLRSRDLSYQQERPAPLSTTTRNMSRCCSSLGPSRVSVKRMAVVSSTPPSVLQSRG